MARARNIKPGFFVNEDLVELDFGVRLLFAGLWTLADREGRLEDRPKKIKIGVFPADNVDVDAMLQELNRYGFIYRYEINGAKYIQINNWHKHQRPHHTEKDSVIPSPDSVLTVKEPLSDGDSPNRDGENPPDSLIHRFTDSLIHVSTGVDTTGANAPEPSEDEIPPDDPPKEPDPPAKPARKNLGIKDLVDQGVDRQHAEDWLAVRRAKGAPLTQTAWKGVLSEAEKAGITAAKAVEIAALNGWRGFKADWMRRDGMQQRSPTAADRRAEWNEELNRELASAPRLPAIDMGVIDVSDN